MLITVLMAGYDANAKTYFDGMYKVCAGRPAFGMSSTAAPIYLMDWLILPNMDSGDGWSAADGDMDIALALLMAHRQWGSSGAINYYQQALNTINAMKAADFATNGVMYARNVSRVSDYMPGHFRSFKAATNDSSGMTRGPTA
jgi:endo-1,4-beta-D-glucanase Y